MLTHRLYDLGLVILFKTKTNIARPRLIMFITIHDISLIEVDIFTSPQGLGHFGEVIKMSSGVPASVRVLDLKRFIYRLRVSFCIEERKNG